MSVKTNTHGYNVHSFRGLQNCSAVERVYQAFYGSLVWLVFIRPLAERNGVLYARIHFRGSSLNDILSAILFLLSTF